MQKMFNWLDKLAGINRENKLAMRLEQIAFIFLILMVLSAPHSIAATQTAWLLGMTAWLVRLFIKPRPKLVRAPLDIALWAFFGWTVITSIFSYAPDISIDKLRGALLFLIFYFVAGNLRNIRAAKFLAFALIFSCMASVVWAPIDRIYGRGVEISGISANSIFTKGVHFDHDTYLAAKGKNLRTLDNSATPETEIIPLIEGDTIVEVEGKKIRTPDELTAAIEKNEVTYLENFRNPEYFTIKVKRSDLLDGANSLEKLGISSWKHNRNWRYAGFYGQIITYAEVLQMIASLALGLFIALDKKRSAVGAVLALCLVGMIFALLLTFTRATQIAFAASAIAMIFAYGNRKMFLTLAAIILPLALVGLFFMQQTRKVGYYDQNDKSVNYRQTIYREGFDLWTRDARNFLLGIGMDSTKRFAKQWHLFDDGRLPAGHFHSTPLQLLVERGLPALLLWFWILWIYARTLLHKLRVQSPESEVQSQREQKLRITNYELRDTAESAVGSRRSAVQSRNDEQRTTSDERETTDENPKSKIQNPKSFDWQITGIILGCFGGLVGFFVSSLVNYSLGDSEVAMVFFILMGIGVSLSIPDARFQIPDSDFKSQMQN